MSQVIVSPPPGVYQIFCTGCRGWLPADRPGVQHGGEACVERCAAEFGCPREAAQAAERAGWVVSPAVLCPACRGREQR